MRGYLGEVALAEKTPPAGSTGSGRRATDACTWVAAGILTGALGAWAALVWAAPSLPASLALQVPQFARALAAGLFLTAGVMRLARWRLTDDPRAARAAAALLLLGAGLPAVALVGPLMQRPEALAHATPAARMLLVFPVLALIAAGSLPRHTIIRPVRVAAVLLAAWAVTVTALANRHLTSAPSLMDVPGVWLAAEIVAAGGWIGLAVAVWRQGRRESRPARNLAALALLLMGMCELLKAHSIAHEPASFGLGPGIQLIAAALATAAAAIELCEAFRTNSSQARNIAHTLVDVQEQLAQVEQVQRERLHDARSAVIGVIGASRLLSQPSAQSVPDPVRLHNLMAAELTRLQAMLDTESLESIEEFELADVLEPIVLAHRLAGGVVDTNLGLLRAIGRPQATATVLANLLDNVRSHAPGASVTVQAEQCWSTIVLAVEDNGAGIAASERERVLLRGARGSTPTPGSGLGLYLAATAMTSQFGTLRLSERRGGGTRVVLTLPAANAAHLSSPVAIRAQAS
jgi:signal transduction histidine kinase